MIPTGKITLFSINLLPEIISGKIIENNFTNT
jgi:hypothetical protein